MYVYCYVHCKLGVILLMLIDGGCHFNNKQVKTYWAKWPCKHHIIAAYSPWINGLVEGTNGKLLLHILKCLCTPDLGENTAMDNRN